MKAKLTFDLPEERVEYEQANKAGHLCGAIGEYLATLRKSVKYPDKDMTEEKEVAVRECMDILYDVLVEHGVEELIE